MKNMTECRSSVGPHEEKGIELKFVGECEVLVGNILKNLSPISRKVFKSKMVIVPKGRESPTPGDSPSK